MRWLISGLRLYSTLAECTERLHSSMLIVFFNPVNPLALVLVTPLVIQSSLIVQTNVLTYATDCNEDGDEDIE